MMIGMLVAGIGCLLAGLVAIGFGIPINEFGLGNTLILAGAVTACTGLLILSMWIAVKELKGTAGQLAAAPALDLKRGSQPAALPRPVGAESGDTAPYGDPASGSPDGPPSMPPPPPWSEEVATRGPRQDAPPAEPAAKPRRNLMFSSSSRKERERAQARTGEVSVAEPPSAPAVPAAPAAEVNAPPPANFDDAWPKSERVRSADAPPRRVARNPSAARQAPPVETQPQVTVLKSGVVDGMAYSLYSDGSIEAQMPEGMMRFASIDELRAHLDQRP